MDQNKFDSIYQDGSSIALNVPQSGLLDHPNMNQNSEEVPDDLSYMAPRALEPQEQPVSAKPEVVRRAAINLPEPSKKRDTVFILGNSPDNGKDTVGTKKSERGSRVMRHKTLFNQENPVEEVNNTKIEAIKHFLVRFLDSNTETIIMAVITIFALFANDLKTIALNPYYDNVFNGFYIIILLVFLSEFLINIWVNQDYFASFFFWLDLFATLSMFLEIDWVLNPLVDQIIM